MIDTTIVRCRIHPGIGIARVGNSPNGFFIGPEVPGVTPVPSGGYKDPQGRIKRQVARFRLYGLNAAGQIVKELTADDAQITWTVHLANKKAAWYQFKLALDIPEASSPSLPPNMQAHRRNAQVTGGNRAHLVIDPGPRSIGGKNTSGPAYHFDSGTFLGHQVPLGELRTGGAGNLLVFGGRGASGTTQANNPPNQVANNDGWYDDTADGPVTAAVVIGGNPVPADPAWVIVGPPSYAPGIIPIVTLYDIAYQAYLDGHPQAPRPVSFTRDIYPILARFDGLQWVNEGFYLGYGWQGQIALLDPAFLAMLARNDAGAASERQQVFGRFRNPSYATVQENAWPRLYGDGFSQPPQYPQQYLAVTREQYRCLSEWAQGNFAADWNPNASIPHGLGDIPLTERPQALDRAALEACPGGPFHPGEEVTWPMRRPSMYAGFCRLNLRKSSDAPEPDYGNTLTPAQALGLNGPLHRSGPGDVTRWMAVPWQTDTANCGSAYPNSYTNQPFPDLPTFWPAIVPNKILTEAAFQLIVSGGLDPQQQQTTFQQRVPWTRHLPSDYNARNAQIITDWYRLGVIEARANPTDGSLPGEMHVETESGFPEVALEADLLAAGGEPPGHHEPGTAPPVENRRERL